MNSSEHEPEVKASLLSAFDLSFLKAAGTFLGVIGSGGGGFAALAFAIGYLAIKKKDELIGLPTTQSDPTSYIRTGALFFSNSAYFLLAATYKLLVALALLALLLALFLVAAKAFRWPRSRRTSRNGQVSGRSPSRGWFLPAAYALLLVLALCTLSLQTAAFDSQNRNLLYKVISDREAKLQRAASGVPALASPAAADVLVWPPWERPLARRINTLLRHPQGRDFLQLFYGQQLTLVLAVLYGAVICRQKHKRRASRIEHLGRTSPEWRPYRVAQVLTPFLYLAVLALLVNLPAAYGVLCLPTNGALVIVRETEQPTPSSGTLLSDLSSGSKEIWLLDEDNGMFILNLVDRSRVRDVTLLGDITDNFLAIEDPQ